MAKIKYNINTFRDLVVAGKLRKDIIKEMAIPNLQQFFYLELRLFKKDKKFYEIPVKYKTKQLSFDFMNKQ